jgi:lysophospholipase L1-like esterase/acetyl esterase/lipase
MRYLVSAICLIAFSLNAICQEVINLYPSKALGSENWTWTEGESTQNMFNTRVVYNVVNPTITVFLPEKNKATGTAMIIAPGGGFHTLSMDSEGIELAKYLVTKGVAAFVLKYRLAHSLTQDPVKELIDKMSDLKTFNESTSGIIPLGINDANTAIKYVRNNAAKFDIDGSKIGMIGFSAGGTVTAGTVYTTDNDSKPNFIAPIYAFIPDDEPFKTAPTLKIPVFLTVATDDQLGLTGTSFKLYDQWKAAGNTPELHVYEKGGHGFGMRKQNLPSDKWHERFTDWMKNQGYLKRKYPADWEKPFTEEQLEGIAKNNTDREKRDWANLIKYRAENTKIGMPKTGKTRVVFTGDSITEGWVKADNEYFEKNNYVGRGISGQTSPQTLLRFRQDVIDLKPSIVIINIGINDIAENTGDYMPEYTLANYQNMIEIAKANNIKVVLASVMPAYEFPWRKEIKDVPAKVMALNEGIKALAVKHKLVYLDYFNALKDERNGLSSEMAGDGVHPKLPCYKIMEKMATEAIGKALKKKKKKIN